MALYFYFRHREARYNKTLELMKIPLDSLDSLDSLDH